MLKKIKVLVIHRVCFICKLKVAGLSLHCNPREISVGVVHLAAIGSSCAWLKSTFGPRTFTLASYYLH